ncbi:Nif3-like dinuclear metal center protein, putative GTP cyclohydrolase [Campylobacter blaseri]|uniref:GTP cyclohydrolase 1 type 2 homolog n=1 Tax=Campylobacter blaseri TaxID=2042961 RepID=A0A2P8R097_9BACT|nr:Nif3-like dinuclear metal center hexameric protein [Campylobacter blaseri]PSM51909.1 Nif3-like dinuclear metal center hexameric protein [Campylobacter blaseri]PSM53693.1 Nif3-like dinuclear metal center hexameric protein [Campylobacter blaseri]QKF85753.1 Nif3-like dinuclear metal center protein, putative GTP cyclohydrolase [Campylobacter blaseri]
MKISEIYQILDEIAPFEDQEEWDNSGLLVGSFDDEFDRVYASLDLDSNLVDSLEENSLIITHHPLIFKGLKRIDYSRYPSNLIQKLIKKDIKLISMHTNYDKHILNKFVAKEILRYEIVSIDDFLINMEVDMSFNEFVDDIKKKLDIPNLRVVKTKDRVKRVALCTGSGISMLGHFDGDCFLTGDLKYHEALEAMENGISLIDINHFESERYFAISLKENLKKKQIEVIITNSVNPFTQI